MDYTPETLFEAAAHLRAAREVVVFTGAGTSAESGIATFRDEGGLWQEFPPEQFGHWPGLVRMAVLRPRTLARFVLAVLEPIATAVPNAGHRAIAALEEHTGVTVVTQNIDRLHSDAGSTIVHEVHGSLFEIVGRRGRFVRLLSRGDMLRLVESLRRAARSRLALGRLLAAVRPMLGLGLRGIYRPKVVLFGEALAQPDWDLACRATSQCDVMITVGTSGTVMPAAGLPAKTRATGATLISVDPETAGLHDLWLPGRAATVLPALVDAAFGGEAA